MKPTWLCAVYYSLNWLSLSFAYLVSLIIMKYHTEFTLERIVFVKSVSLFFLSNNQRLSPTTITTGHGFFKVKNKMRESKLCDSG